MYSKDSMEVVLQATQVSKYRLNYQYFPFTSIERTLKGEKTNNTKTSKYHD